MNEKRCYYFVIKCAQNHVNQHVNAYTEQTFMMYLAHCVE